MENERWMHIEGFQHIVISDRGRVAALRTLKSGKETVTFLSIARNGTFQFKVGGRAYYRTLRVEYRKLWQRELPASTYPKLKMQRSVK